MTLEVGRLTRLKSAIDNTTTMKADPMSASALAAAASKFRAQVADALDDALKSEFELLFPDKGISGGHDIFAQARQAEEARVILLGISGWLAGLVKTGEQ
jgi:hypothetical protein